MKKSKLFIFITIIMCLCMASVSLAANVKVQINGEIIDFTDSNGAKVEAQTINSRTMVPLRKIFEVLGCTVDWKADTKEITATKSNRVIKMQIDNKEVSFIIDGNKESKTLDQAPIIKDNRTLVPLRFISEALDMQVGWDAQNSTAVIIDYEEIAKIIKEKSPYLYNYFTTSPNASIEKNYYDDADSSNNSTTFIHVTEDSSNNDYNEVSVKVSGKSEFADEVASEEWNNFSYKAYDNNYIETSNYVFSKMLNIKKNEKLRIDFNDFGMSDNSINKLSDYIKEISLVDDSQINVNTFKTLKSDWNKFANTFLAGNNKKLELNDFTYDCIDLNKIFSQRTGNALATLQFLNNRMFKISYEPNDLFAEYPTVTYSFSSSENEAKFVILVKNEYKEREEYILILHN